MQRSSAVADPCDLLYFICNKEAASGAQLLYFICNHRPREGGSERESFSSSAWAEANEASGRRETRTRGARGRRADKAGSDAPRGDTSTRSWDADASAAGKEAEVEAQSCGSWKGGTEAGGGAELPAPKDAPVKS